MTWPIIYFCIVIGGWCNLRPVRAKDLSMTWRLVYQVPTNAFIFIDRLVNLLLTLPGILKVKRNTKTIPWETVSSHIAIDYPGSLAHVVIDIVMLDWGTAYRPGHCERYKGI